MQLPLSSFKAVEKAISRIEDESSATFWQRDCHTIKAAGVSQSMKAELVYAEITYYCMHRDKISYSSKSSGKRPNQSLSWFITAVHYLECIYTI